MTKFMFVYRNDIDTLSCEPSPEEMQQAMAAWGQWYQKIGAAIIDGGDGLLPVGKKIKSDGTVTDGPFIEAKELVGGYTIVQANSIDEAADLAKGCPILARGGNVEIRQLSGYADVLDK